MAKFEEKLRQEWETLCADEAAFPASLGERPCHAFAFRSARSSWLGKFVTRSKLHTFATCVFLKRCTDLFLRVTELKCGF